MQAPCNTATLSTLFGFTLPRYLKARSKCGCYVSRGSSLASVSTHAPTSSTISQGHCTSLAIFIPTLIGILGVPDESFSPMGGTSNGNTLFSKCHTSMPLSSCGPMFVSCFAYAYQLSSNSSWSPSFPNSKQIVPSIVHQMFIHYCLKYSAPTPLTSMTRTCENSPPKWTGKLFLSFPHFLSRFWMRNGLIRTTNWHALSSGLRSIILYSLYDYLSRGFWKIRPSLMLHWCKGVMANFRINTQHFCMLHTSCSKECIQFNFDVLRGVCWARFQIKFMTHWEVQSKFG